MKEGPLSHQPHLAEILWQHCAAKHCCCVRSVLPTGADIVRIATALQVSPERFLHPIPTPSAHGFVLAHGQPLVYPALARRIRSSQATTCVFLLQFGDQASRCGINALRPLVCQSFPAVNVAGQVEVDPAHSCMCRTWSLAEIDRERVSTLLRQQAEERERYHEVMGAWNAVVALTKQRYTFSNVCQYMLEAYEAGR